MNSAEFEATLDAIIADCGPFWRVTRTVGTPPGEGLVGLPDFETREDELE